ncbi:Hypothetical protein FKW44_014212 [Caligus rogercresseyi]|uniref:Uncharacterized protein n=1 Tax=Caligus rogercresseyi TaxID=217165 RepID=A0A7T8GZ75_CALRO|nr:Hypothetical protein FKW44_014212 [Caligus rogercresseyi]
MIPLLRPYNSLSSLSFQFSWSPMNLLEERVIPQRPQRQRSLPSRTPRQFDQSSVGDILKDIELHSPIFSCVN